MMEDTTPSSGGKLVVVLAALVVIVAGMKAATAIVVPFLLSLFIALICAPPLFWMKRKGVPTLLAAVLVIVAIMGLGTVFAAVIGASLNGFSESLPLYEDRIREQTAAALTWLQQMGLELPDTTPDYFDPGGIMRLVGKMLTSLSGVLANAFLILLTVIFILMEAAAFPAKLQSAFSRPEESLGQVNKFLDSFNRYIAIKTFTSLLTGLFIAGWLSIQGVDFALLWGLLAFVLNYVPNIGSLIAAVPGVLITLIQLGVGHAAIAAVGYFVVNTAMGSILEPRLMGRGLGLSTLVVFLSLVFWGWVLGPVGMLLSVPLTVALKIGLEVNTSTRPIAILLGPAPEARAVTGEISKPSQSGKH